MNNGITYKVGDVTDTHVTLIERADLTHPDCPVVCFDKSVSFIEQHYPMSYREFEQWFLRHRQT